MMHFCLSCAIPLSPEQQGKNPQYCKHCADEDGNLQPREYVQKGIAEFLKMLQPLDDSTAIKRADYYLKAMPAWAEK